MYMNVSANIYANLASIVTRGRNFRKYDWFPVDSARRNSCAQIP